MEFDDNQIASLIFRPSERLNVELKNWIDLDQTEDIAKIVTAALALRNRNGGYIVIGFDNKTVEPSILPTSMDVVSSFHADKIQGLISKFSSEPFEIKVAFPERDGQKHPIILIPDGVRTPVAAKADLYSTNKNTETKRLILCGEVYFRTLRTNGTVSTARARPEDWTDIVRICFDNREADFGGFLRRQIAGFDITSFFALLSQYNSDSKPPNMQTLKQKTVTLLDDGEKKYIDSLNARAKKSNEQFLIDAGEWSTALIIEPPNAGAIPNKDFLNIISSANPNYSDWPFWFDSGTFGDDQNRPICKGGSWEKLLLISGYSNYLDFYRMNPKGELYLRRAYPDDITNKVAPMSALDPYFVILQVAEVIAVGLALSKALGWAEKTANLGFSFRWRKLRNRRLSDWTNSGTFFGNYMAHDDEITTFTELSLETPVSAISSFVEQATKELFVLFDGYQMQKNDIETLCRRLTERRL